MDAADWHVVYAVRMNIAADAIRENVRTRTGAKTENVLLRKIIHIAISEHNLIKIDRYSDFGT